MLILAGDRVPTPEARARERAALRRQIGLLEEEWRTGMERDTLILLDHACARLAALDEPVREAVAAAPSTL